MWQTNGIWCVRTRGKCRKHEPRAGVFYTCISRVFPNVQSVFSQCNTRLRLFYLLYDIKVMWQKKQHAFTMFYTLIKHGFSTNQREQGPIYIIIKMLHKF